MARKVIRTSQRRKRATVRYRRPATSTPCDPRQDTAEAVASTAGEIPNVWENAPDWLADIGAALPVTLDEWADVRDEIMSRFPGLAFRLKWPVGEPALVLEVSG